MCVARPVPPGEIDCELESDGAVVLRLCGLAAAESIVHGSGHYYQALLSHWPFESREHFLLGLLWQVWETTKSEIWKLL